MGSGGKGGKRNGNPILFANSLSALRPGRLAGEETGMCTKCVNGWVGRSMVIEWVYE